MTHDPTYPNIYRPPLGRLLHGYVAYSLAGDTSVIIRG
jgi:hypothetical protein